MNTEAEKTQQGITKRLNAIQKTLKRLREEKERLDEKSRTLCQYAKGLELDRESE